MQNSGKPILDIAHDCNFSAPLARLMKGQGVALELSKMSGVVYPGGPSYLVLCPIMVDNEMVRLGVGVVGRNCVLVDTTQPIEIIALVEAGLPVALADMVTTMLNSLLGDRNAQKH